MAVLAQRPQGSTSTHDTLLQLRGEGVQEELKMDQIKPLLLSISRRIKN